LSDSNKRFIAYSELGFLSITAKVKLTASYLFEGYRSFFPGNADEVDTVLNDRQVTTVTVLTSLSCCRHCSVIT
ncbi:hypothetical protein T09_7167, partial [Trichinella sp. T9]